MARARRLWQGAAFGLTGLGTALLGSVLPATLRHWQLSDSRGGLLLLAAWGGSTSGALLVRDRPQGGAVAGLWLSAASLGLLGFSPAAVLPGLYLLFGLGLGLTMTAVSILRSSEVPPVAVDVELNRLNLVWAVGAVLAPFAGSHSLESLTLSALFLALAVLFGVAGLGLWAARVPPPSDIPASPPASAAGGGVRPWAPLRFGLFAALAVGLESAIGSWLTTYTQRTSQAVSAAAMANTVFWGGLLLSRAAHSFPLGWLRSLGSRWGHLALVALGVLLLLVPPRPGTLAAAGFLCGFGLGPLYPYVLSLVLPRFRSNAVFVLAGAGASILPWLTGVLSSASHSLRVGLAVPALGSLFLLGTALRLQRDQAL